VGLEPLYAMHVLIFIMPIKTSRNKSAKLLDDKQTEEIITPNANTTVISGVI